MSAPEPDLAALFQKHRETMYKVAISVLRDRGLQSHAEDIVSIVFSGLLEKRPEKVWNWEAWLVLATKRRALDYLKSAGASRSDELPEEAYEIDATPDGIHQMEMVERAAVANRVLAAMSERARYVAGEVLIADRSRADVARELGVTTARISQIIRDITTAVREAVEGGG